MALKLANRRRFWRSTDGFASLATCLASRATSFASDANRSNREPVGVATESLCCDWLRENTDEMEIARDRVGVAEPELVLSNDGDGDMGGATEGRGVELRL